MALLQNSMNYTEYVVGDLSNKNDVNDYNYYTDNTEMDSKNCTKDMQNCTKQAFDEEQQTNNEAENEDESVTETTDGADDSKTKTITLLDFSNYLIPSHENSED